MYAEKMRQELTELGYDVMIDETGEYSRVLVGDHTNLQDAINLENSLRRAGYHTVIVSDV